LIFETKSTILVIIKEKETNLTNTRDKIMTIQKNEDNEVVIFETEYASELKKYLDDNLDRTKSSGFTPDPDFYPYYHGLNFFVPEWFYNKDGVRLWASCGNYTYKLILY
jgi:hypothetical protein